MSLFPITRHFLTKTLFICNWHILGSLTTPTCNEAVTWIIFPDTIPISLSQMSKFRSLSNGIEGLLLVDNYRHLQPVGNRKIFLRSISSRTVELEKIVEMEMHGRALANNRTDSNMTEDDSEWYYNWICYNQHYLIYESVNKICFNINACKFMFLFCYSFNGINIPEHSTTCVHVSLVLLSCARVRT